MKIFRLKILLSVFMFLFLIDQTFAQEFGVRSTSNSNDSLQTTNRNYYITPYLGSSTLVGNFGIELQYKNYGYNIGLLKSTDISEIDNILCGGLRYYFKPHHHSWVVGVVGGYVLDDLKPDDLDGDTGIVMVQYIGVLIGYRWIWWDKLHLNVGAGPNYIDWKRIKDGNKQKYLPTVETVVGYSF